MSEITNQGAMTWIIRRIEANGETTQTVEMDETAASSLYANWCNNAKRFNDRTVELVRVIRMQTIVSQKTNTDFESELQPVAGTEGSAH